MSLTIKEQRIVLLVKIDATNLFDRIVERRLEYVEMFSLHRERDIFYEIFKNRYESCSIDTLSFLPIEIIEAVNDFYLKCDALHWYLQTTQDMPNTIEENIERRISQLRKQLETCVLYMNAELAGRDE